MSGAPPRRSLLRGIFQLARFRADGFAEFGATPQAFLNSLAPLVAFPLVGGALMLLAGGGLDAVTDLLATMVALLAPAVITEWLARLWRRQHAWLRYAVAFNWCQWAVPVVAVLVVVAMAMLSRLGLGERQAAVAALIAITAYGITLHWFLARRGLALSAGAAVLFVLAVNIGTVLLVLVPRLIDAAL